MREQEKQVQLKNHNRRTVLSYIRKNHTVTKAELASVTGLTFMAIKKILEELEDLELVKTDKKKISSTGRKAVSYTINETYKYTVGVHVNKYHTSMALMNLEGTIIQSRRYPMENQLSGQNEFVGKLAQELEELIRNSQIGKERILGIGVGVPGPVDCRNGVILTPPNMGFLNYLPLKEILEKRLGYPVDVYKDTNVIAFGEYWHGGEKGGEDLIYIDVDMGIGSGMIIDGNLTLGINGMAGEFGHVVVDVNGPRCNCGNRGCLEAMSSGIAALRELEMQLEQNPSHPLYEKKNQLVMEDIFLMAERKDVLTISILNQCAYYMGVAISSLIHLMDPPKVVLGGILIQKYPMYFDIVCNVVNTKKMKGTGKNLLMVSELGLDAGVIGAGEIVAGRFFGDTVNEIFDRT